MFRSERRVQDLIKKAAEGIRAARKVVALTGAGMSVESGIAPFRGVGGIWEKYNPEEYIHIDAFRSNPAKSWKLLKEMGEAILRARPNPGHLALAELEQMGHLSSIITQNIDGLHQEAGNTDVIEFHGNARRLVCTKCGRQFRAEDLRLETLPPGCQCGGILKPEVVFFGELIPPGALQRAQQEAQSCDLMLVVGTSVVVYPAADIPKTAKWCGAEVVEINPQPTPLSFSVSDYIIKGAAGKVLPQIVAELKSDLENSQQIPKQRTGPGPC